VRRGRQPPRSSAPIAWLRPSARCCRRADPRRRTPRHRGDCLSLPIRRQLAAGNARHHVVDRFAGPVRLHLQMHFRRAGADVIGQRSAPRQLAGATGRQCRQQRCASAYDSGSAESASAFLPQAVAGAGHPQSPHTGVSDRGIDRNVGHRAALHAVGRTPAALRVRIAEK